MNGEDVLRVAKKLRGSRRPSALKAYQLRRQITRFDKSSGRLRDSVA